MSKQLLLVLGMHRSGTSALTGLLTLLGAPLPKHLMSARPDNPKGFFESSHIASVNDRVLRQMSSSWDDWRFLKLPDKATKLHKDFVDQIMAGIRHEFAGQPFLVVKDPRICRLVPLWLQAALAGGYEPLAIIPLRHPYDVAKSLNKRNGMPLSRALLIWLAHVMEAEFYTRNTKRVFVSMDALLRDWRTVVERVDHNLKPSWPNKLKDIADRVDNYLDLNLVHHSSGVDVLEENPLLSGWVRRVYESLLTLEKNPHHKGAVIELNAVRNEFLAAQSLFGDTLSSSELELEKERAELEKLRSSHASYSDQFLELRNGVNELWRMSTYLSERMEAHKQEILETLKQKT